MPGSLPSLIADATQENDSTQPDRESLGRKAQRCRTALPVVDVGYDAAVDPTTASKRVNSAVQPTTFRGRRLAAPGAIRGGNQHPQFDAALHMELFVEVFNMRMNGLARQAKRPGDLPLALARHETTGDLAHARR